MTHETTPVLIIGAGPTGMALSIRLLQLGVPHVLVDKLAEGQNTSRAGVIHAHTLDALRPLGVTERLVERGLPVTQFAVRDRHRALLELSFGGLPTEHPYLLMLPQNETEAVLAGRIEELGGTIRRGVTAEKIETHANGVLVTVVENGERHVIESSWVVGGDGMRSLVRETMQTPYVGATYDASFVLADVFLDRASLPLEVSLFFSPEGLVVLAPLPDGRYRVVATMQDAPEKPGVTDVQALLDARGPSDTRLRVREVTASSRFRLHHRVADSYRVGRLMVMGDAAHVHSPAGGQGMNCGIVDAVVLGELLAGVVSGKHGEDVLDLYPRLRRPAAIQVLGLADRLTQMAVMRSPLMRALRNLALRIVNRIPFIRRNIEMNLAGLARANLGRVPEALRS